MITGCNSTQCPLLRERHLTITYWKALLLSRNNQWWLTSENIRDQPSALLEATPWCTFYPVASILEPCWNRCKTNNVLASLSSLMAPLLLNIPHEWYTWQKSPSNPTLTTRLMVERKLRFSSFLKGEMSLHQRRGWASEVIGKDAWKHYHINFFFYFLLIMRGRFRIRTQRKWPKMSTGCIIRVYTHACISTHIHMGVHTHTHTHTPSDSSIDHFRSFWRETTWKYGIQIRIRR